MKDAIRQKFNEHRCAARKRRIGFMLTYDQWLKIWKDSGYWDKRGCRVGQYVMARKGDAGSYAIGNIDIVPVSKNCADIWSGRKHAKETRQKMSESGARRWRTLSSRQRTRLSLALSEGQLNRWAGRTQ